MQTRRPAVFPFRLAPLLLSAASLLGQHQAPAEAFRPEAAQGEVRVDFARLAETGVWEEIMSSLLGGLLRRGEKELGFPLDALDDFRMWIRVPESAVEGQRMRVQRVVVMAGDVALPTWAMDVPIIEEGAGYTLRARTEHNYVLHRPGELYVEGMAELVAPILHGEQRPGVPGADQLSLQASKTPALASIYADLIAARRSSGDFAFLTEADYPQDDRSTHFLMRLDAVGEDDEMHLVLSAIVRHEKGEAGLELTEKNAREWLQIQGEGPLAAMRGLFEKVGFERGGADLRATLDLGRLRDAVGVAATLGTGLFAARAAKTAVELEARAAAAQRAFEAARKEAERGRGGDGKDGG